MNIKRIIDKNGKLILLIIAIIVFILFIIKSLNSYYEKDEQNKMLLADQNTNIEESQNNNKVTDYKTESNTVKQTINSFVNYCNKKELENAYSMLTQECKDAMFPTIEDFERIYINNIYNIERTFELVKWSTDGNKSTYLVTLYGDLLATGGTTNTTQEYYTFIKDNSGNYKININNYIYGEDSNLEKNVQNIIVKIGRVDIYEDHETIEITVMNKSSNIISLTGNKYRKNIYLQNSKDTTYSSFNSEFDSKEIIMNPNTTKNFVINFNKSYSSINKAQYLVLSDIILDYEEYLECEDKENYSNRTSIKLEYQK